MDEVIFHIELPLYKGRKQFGNCKVKKRVAEVERVYSAVYVDREVKVFYEAAVIHFPQGD